jgi:hypothetical protein
MQPGGKQAFMCNGWFVHNRQKISQEMNFPANDPEFPSLPKGMKQVLTECGLWSNGLQMQCKDSCNLYATACCAKRLLDLQSDFKAQCSLVQEVIEADGHLCIVLPKFHCELNFIEFFWGAVKKYLCDNCDYAFTTLKENLLKVMASVQLSTIRKWEHRMIRWMEAYCSGLGVKDAQMKVKEFSSKHYTSYRCIPETIVRQFDS